MNTDLHQRLVELDADPAATGVLGREALAAELGAASIAVFPSVVASDLPGLNDAVEDDISGLLTTPGFCSATQPCAKNWGGPRPAVQRTTPSTR